MKTRDQQNDHDQEISFTAAQHFPLTSILFEPIFTNSLCPGARELFVYLSFRAWQKKDLEVRAAHGGSGKKYRNRKKPSFLVRNTGMSASSIKRHIKVLSAVGLIRCTQVNRDKGNKYLIEPLLLGQFCWKQLPLRHLERSKLFQMVQSGPSEYGQKTAEISEMVQKGPSVGLKRTIAAQLARTGMVQNGPQIYLLYSLLLSESDGAQRQSPTKFAGGVPGERSEGDQRGPNGQDQKSPEKGIGLPADNIASKARAAVAAKCDADAAAEKEKRQRPVKKREALVEGVRSNFHARV